MINTMKNSTKPLVRKGSGWGTRIIGASAIAGALLFGLTATPSFADELTGPNSSAVTSSAVVSASDDGEMHATKLGLVVNVTNNSSYDLRWVGGNGADPDNVPKSILPPGGTDRLVFTGGVGGLQTHPTWQVVGTEESYLLSPAFGVPSIGPNALICSPDEITAGSPVKLSKCDIGSGWDPDGHVTFVNK